MNQCETYRVNVNRRVELICMGTQMPGVEYGPHTGYVAGGDSLASWKAHSNLHLSKLLHDVDLSGHLLGTVSLPSCWLSNASAPVRVVQMTCLQVHQRLCEALRFSFPLFLVLGIYPRLSNSRQVPSLLLRYILVLLGFSFHLFT